MTLRRNTNEMRLEMKRCFFLMIQMIIPGLLWAGTTNLQCGVSVDFSYNSGAPLGSNLTWNVVLVNYTNAARVCKLTMDADALSYNGDHLGDVATQFTTNTLVPNATNIINLIVLPATYTNWTGKTRTFELSAVLEVEGQSDIWIDEGRIVMQTSTNILTVTPASPIQQGHSLTGTVSYLNPFSMSLHNVKVNVTADEGLSTNNTITESSWEVGTVSSNAWITVSTNYTAGQVGTHNISALITADELREVEGNSAVEVVAP